MHFASSIHLVVISKDKMPDKRRYVNEVPYIRYSVLAH